MDRFTRAEAREVRHRGRRWRTRSRGAIGRVGIRARSDAGIALAMSSTLGRGVITESAVETARADQASNRVRAGIGFAQTSSVSGQIDEQQSVAVTESEVRKQTLESIMVVPLMSMLARVRALAEAVTFATAAGTTL